MGKGEIYGTDDPVKSIDAQNVSQTAKMKGTEVSLLSGVEARSLVAIE